MYNEIKNSIDFYIRNKTKFSRKNFVETNLENFRRNEAENKYTQDILAQFFEKRVFKNAKILDIGSKNWFYAKGEYNFFKSFCLDFCMDGVELDAYRLYSNFYSRYEVAKYHIRELENVNYIAGDLLDLNNKYDYIIWFLPFVTVKPLELWGLPKKYFRPEKMLCHAYSLLNTNGQMLIINQGENEFSQQCEYLERMNIIYKNLGKVKSKYFEYKNDRFGLLIQK